MLGDYRAADTAYATQATYDPFGPDDAGVLPSETDGAPAQKQGSAAGFLIGAIAAAALVTFGFQNTESVPVRFLWFDGSVPLWFAMAAAAIGSGARSPSSSIGGAAKEAAAGPAAGQAGDGRGSDPGLRPSITCIRLAACSPARARSARCRFSAAPRNPHRHPARCRSPAPMSARCARSTDSMARSPLQASAHWPLTVRAQVAHGRL